MWETQPGVQAPQEPPPTLAADEHTVLGPNVNANVYAPRKCQFTLMVCLCHIIASPMDHNHPMQLRHITAQCDFAMSLPNASSLPHHIITCPMYYNYPT